MPYLVSAQKVNVEVLASSPLPRIHFLSRYLKGDDLIHTKPYHIYTALTRAVDDYCTRHDIGRGAFALRVGFNGPNAENQLSNHLNPRSNKNISHEREYMIMCELDDKARELYFSMRAKEWGMDVSYGKISHIQIKMSFHALADRAMIDGSEAFCSIKEALEDGVLSKKELKRISKEAKEAADCYREIVDAAESKLKELQ